MRICSWNSAINLTLYSAGHLLETEDLPGVDISNPCYKEIEVPHHTLCNRRVAHRDSTTDSQHTAASKPDKLAKLHSIQFRSCLRLTVVSIASMDPSV
jgi:hypothetical protein